MANKGKAPVLRRGLDGAAKRQALRGFNVAQQSSNIVLFVGGYTYHLAHLDESGFEVADSFKKDGSKSNSYLVVNLVCNETGETIQWYPTSVRKTFLGISGSQARGKFAKRLREYLASEDCEKGKDTIVEIAKNATYEAGDILEDGTTVTEEGVKNKTNSVQKVKRHLSGSECLWEFIIVEVGTHNLRAVVNTRRSAYRDDNGNRKLTDRAQMVVGLCLDTDDDYSSEVAEMNFDEEI